MLLHLQACGILVLTVQLPAESGENPMWNYSFIIPSFLIMLILLGYYFFRPKIPVRAHNTFIWLLVTECLVVMIDLLSTVADENYTSFPVSVLYILNLLYFLGFMCRILMFYLFTTDVVRLNILASKTRAAASLAVFAAAQLIVLASPFAHTVFYIGSEGYVKGPFYNILYFVFLFYIFLSLATLWRYRERLKREELAVAVIYNCILLVGILIRFLLPQVLILNTFCLMAIIMIYLTFMNPDLYLSERSRAFNNRAFRDVLEEQMGFRPFRILCLVLHNYTDEREIYGLHQMDEGLILISSYIANNWPACNAFYLRNGCFAVLGSGTMDWDAMQKEIHDRFQKSWRAEETDLFLNTAFVRISDASGVSSPAALIDRLLAAFIEAGHRIDPSSDILIDLDKTNKVDRQTDVKRTLEKVIENNEVEIYLQPLISSEGLTMSGAEVLARIRGADGEMISPELFIPIAEQNGQINRLGEQVLEKACRFISEGGLEATGMGWLNVNLSPVQCMNKNLAEEFKGILDRYGVDAELIHLEVTEASMEDLTMLQKQINNLLDSHFKLTLDDYGAGYSNLTRVKHYPFINIKLDMEVVWDYFYERDVLLPAIVGAFKQLQFSVTAEGIESQEMADALTEIGCDYLQGYYFSKPLPVDEFLQKYDIKN